MKPLKLGNAGIWIRPISRGGVEDTRLEAKAKDTKKIRGQGQPFRGQTLSRPRTGMLEAKAKNQGHKAQVLSKKKKKKVFTKIFQAISKKIKIKNKVFTKIFQAISTKKRFPKNFSSAPQNFNIPKNSAVLEPRTGQFSRTWGLEAEAKNLTFEAKAKDFKMCPQGRPRGLHLCLLDHCFSTFFQLRNTFCIWKILRNTKKRCKDFVVKYTYINTATKLTTSLQAKANKQWLHSKQQTCWLNYRIIAQQNVTTMATVLTSKLICALTSYVKKKRMLTERLMMLGGTLVLNYNNYISVKWPLYYILSFVSWIVARTVLMRLGSKLVFTFLRRILILTRFLLVDCILSKFEDVNTNLLTTRLIRCDKSIHFYSN